MANNFAAIMPRLLAMGLKSLRQKAMMPMVVNRGYDAIAGERGSSIDVPIPSSVVAQDVAPSNVPPTVPDTTPTLVNVPLDQWKEAAFFLTDKDLVEVGRGVVPMQAQEAMNTLADTVNLAILALYVDVYGFTGTPGTTPFATSTADATNARVVLNKQRAPMGDRRMVVDPVAEGNALNLQAFQDMSWRGDREGILEGEIGRKLGFDWYMHQGVPTHTAGTLTGTISTSGVGNTAGVKSVTVATDGGEAVNLVKGDIITFAGHTQTYVVTAASTIGASTTGTIAINPGLAVTVAAGATVTAKASHVANLAFHRDAFVFASRPLGTEGNGLGSQVSAMTDADSGLTLRLEVTREHRRLKWAFDILYGVRTVRPELAVRVAG